MTENRIQALHSSVPAFITISSACSTPAGLASPAFSQLSETTAKPSQKTAKQRHQGAEALAFLEAQNHNRLPASAF